MSLAEMFRERNDEEVVAGRIYGVAVGIVTNNRDPERRGRVRVKFPWLSDREESFWARQAVLLAGANTGTFFVPAVGDEVLVAFERGDINRPYIVGSLWNGKDTPPIEKHSSERTLGRIRTRSGHTITMDDSPGARGITIEDGSGECRVHMDSDKGTVSIEAQNGITIRATDGDVVIQGKSVKIEEE